MRFDVLIKHLSKSEVLQAVHAFHRNFVVGPGQPDVVDLQHPVLGKSAALPRYRTEKLSHIELKQLSVARLHQLNLDRVVRLQNDTALNLQEVL